MTNFQSEQKAAGVATFENDSPAVRRALVLTNPKARQVIERLDSALDLLRDQGLELIIAQPEIADMGEVIAEHRDDCDRIIVAGGDGSLNAAIDEIVKTDLPLGVLPLGTANDLARTLGIPSDPLEAARIIAADQTRAIDLGQANDTYFFNVASIGLSVDITQKLSRKLKKRWGVFAYLWTAASVLRASRPFRVTVTCGEEVWRGRSLQITVGNGRFYGGGMTVAHDAVIDDGRLDLYSLELRHSWQIFGLMRALRKGTLSGKNYVRTATGTEIQIEPRHTKRVNTDGEITTRTPVTFRVAPAAVRVFAPANPESVA